jgi:hypothetical protein
MAGSAPAQKLLSAAYCAELAAEVRVGIGRIVALFYRSSTQHQIY